MARVLIIDDDISVATMLKMTFSKEGHEVVVASSLAEGSAEVKAEPYDVVFLDVNLPDGCGLDRLEEIVQAPSAPEVIILTGEGDPDGVELAVRSGACDYIEKGGSVLQIKAALRQALRLRNMKSRRESIQAFDTQGIIGNSPAIRGSFELMAQAAGTDASVLVSGGTGTGKELFSRAIHRNSRRKSGNFVVVDCAALPESLIHSTLFGHTKGAYTGADRSQIGLVGHADGGTLFLDEVGELSLSMQKAFLRVLQEKRYTPVGSDEERASDFRLIAATNRDLDQMALDNGFRADLLYRLRSLVIALPPLCERKQDIPLLAFDHIRNLCCAQDADPKGMTPDFLDALGQHDWPGNVRELLQEVERAWTSAANDHTLLSQHLSENLRINLARSALRPSKEKAPVAQSKAAVAKTDTRLASWKTYRSQAIADAELTYLQRLQIASQGNLTEASAISGLSKPRLYALMQKYGLSRKGQRHA